MAVTKFTIPWNDNSGNNLYLDIDTEPSEPYQDEAVIDVSTDNNDTGVNRVKNVSFKTPFPLVGKSSIATLSLIQTTVTYRVVFKRDGQYLDLNNPSISGIIAGQSSITLVPFLQRVKGDQVLSEESLSGTSLVEVGRGGSLGTYDVVMNADNIILNFDSLGTEVTPANSGTITLETPIDNPSGDDFQVQVIISLSREANEVTTSPNISLALVSSGTEINPVAAVGGQCIVQISGNIQSTYTSGSTSQESLEWNKVEISKPSNVNWITIPTITSSVVPLTIANRTTVEGEKRSSSIRIIYDGENINGTLTMIYQEENVVESTSKQIVVPSGQINTQGYGASAAGGNFGGSIYLEEARTYTSGSISRIQDTTNPPSISQVSGSDWCTYQVNPYTSGSQNIQFTIDSRGTVEGAERSSQFNCSYEGYTDATFYVYQQANEVTGSRAVMFTLTQPTMGNQENPVSAGGNSIAVTYNLAKTPLYSSGSAGEVTYHNVFTEEERENVGISGADWVSISSWNSSQPIVYLKVESRGTEYSSSVRNAQIELSYGAFGPDINIYQAANICLGIAGMASAELSYSPTLISVSGGTSNLFMYRMIIGIGYASGSYLNITLSNATQLPYTIPNSGGLVVTYAANNFVLAPSPGFTIDNLTGTITASANDTGSVRQCGGVTPGIGSLIIEDSEGNEVGDYEVSYNTSLPTNIQQGI